MTTERPSIEAAEEHAARAGRWAARPGGVDLAKANALVSIAESLAIQTRLMVETTTELEAGL